MNSDKISDNDIIVIPVKQYNNEIVQLTTDNEKLKKRLRFMEDLVQKELHINSIFAKKVKIDDVYSEQIDLDLLQTEIELRDMLLECTADDFNILPVNIN